MKYFFQHLLLIFYISLFVTDAKNLNFEQNFFLEQLQININDESQVDTEFSCSTAYCDSRNSNTMKLSPPPSINQQWQILPGYGSQNFLGCSSNAAVGICIINHPKTPIIALNATGSILWNSTGTKNQTISPIDIKIPPLFFGDRGPGFILCGQNFISEMDILGDVRYTIEAKPETVGYPVVTDDDVFLLLAGGNFVWSILLGQGTTFASTYLKDLDGIFSVTGTPVVNSLSVYYPTSLIQNETVTNAGGIACIRNRNSVVDRMSLDWIFKTSGTIYFSPLLVNESIIFIEKINPKEQQVVSIIDKGKHAQLLWNKPIENVGQLLADPRSQNSFWICDLKGCSRRSVSNGDLLESFLISNFMGTDMEITGPVSIANQDFLISVTHFKFPNNQNEKINLNQNKENENEKINLNQNKEKKNKGKSEKVFIEHSSYIISLPVNSTSKPNWIHLYSKSHSAASISFGQKAIVAKSGFGYTKRNIIFSTFGNGILGIAE